MAIALNFRLRNNFFKVYKNLYRLFGNCTETCRKTHSTIQRRDFGTQELDNTFACKVAVVTGGGSETGYYIGEELLGAGAKAVVIGDTVDEVTTDLRKKYGHGKVSFQICDVSKKDDMENFFKKAMNNFGKIDIVVNNTSKIIDEKLEGIAAINIRSTVYGTLLGFQYMSTSNRGEGGIIVNKSSIFGIQSIHPLPVYTGSKHFVIGFTRAMGNEYFYRHSKVKVMALLSGATRKSSEWDPMQGQLEQIAELDEETEKQISPLVCKGSKGCGKRIMAMLKTGENGCIWVAEGGGIYKVCIPHWRTFKPKREIKIHQKQSKPEEKPSEVTQKINQFELYRYRRTDDSFPTTSDLSNPKEVLQKSINNFAILEAPQSTDDTKTSKANNRKECPGIPEKRSQEISYKAKDDLRINDYAAWKPKKASCKPKSHPFILEEDSRNFKKNFSKPEQEFKQKTRKIEEQSYEAQDHSYKSQESPYEYKNSFIKPREKPYMELWNAKEDIYQPNDDPNMNSRKSEENTCQPKHQLLQIKKSESKVKGNSKEAEQDSWQCKDNPLKNIDDQDKIKDVPCILNADPRQHENYSKPKGNLGQSKEDCNKYRASESKEDPSNSKDPLKLKSDTNKPNEDLGKLKDDSYEAKDSCKLKKNSLKPKEDSCKVRDDTCETKDDDEPQEGSHTGISNSSKPKEYTCKFKGDPCTPQGNERKLKDVSTEIRKNNDNFKGNKHKLRNGLRRLKKEASKKKYKRIKI